jgi:hypothetical protein
MANVARTGTVVGGVFMSEVYGASGGGDGSFNSVLTLSNSPSVNCKLKVTLNVYLKAYTPSQISDIMARSIAQALGVPIDPNRKYSQYPDSDKKSFLVKDWQAGEWQNFVSGFVGQAMAWNRKFCLMPPDDFPYFDIYQGKAQYRPNVVCEFGLNLFYSPTAAHKTIEVVNLNVSAAGAYRSDSGTYSSDDTSPSTVPATTTPGGTQNYTQPTVTHEVGHALGLPHIGVSRGLMHCNLAVIYQKYSTGTLPALYTGGSNSNACYGDNAGPGDAANIMGFGDKFAQENAKPWLDRLNDHSWQTFDMSKWKVSLTEIQPMSIVMIKR